MCFRRLGAWLAVVVSTALYGCVTQRVDTRVSTASPPAEVIPKESVCDTEALAPATLTNLRLMAKKSAGTALEENFDYSMMGDVLRLTGARSEVDSMQEATIIVPSNRAFADMGPERYFDLSKNSKKSRVLLDASIIPQRLSSREIVGRHETIGHGTISGSAENGSVVVNRARIICSDIQTLNATIHIVEKMME
ncbi:hypothetical protein Acsp01_83510 [Actinoplanes sp. NBRC 101535]|nr:hypothetical protein Acsp01_83510 [Actinoplanes sp. NBRC 101535]